MYKKHFSSIFNPLVASGDQNGWLEELATSPQIDINADLSAEDFIRLFGFENLNDCSQSSYITWAFDKFTKYSKSLLSTSFDIAVRTSKVETNNIALHYLGPEEYFKLVEEVMKNLFEKEENLKVDTTYHYPRLICYAKGNNSILGWAESRTGSFLFTDSDAHKKMSDFLKVPAKQLVPV